MDPPPELVYRRLNFVHGVPPAYDWTGADPEVRVRGGCGIQRMDVNTWLNVIERGGCDCPVCTKNRSITDPSWTVGQTVSAVCLQNPSGPGAFAWLFPVCLQNLYLANPAMLVTIVCAP
jgi:hypothetical protein